MLKANEIWGGESDKKNFVQNLSELLKQTKTPVESLTLDDKQVVHVRFKGGHEIEVNVRGDSWLAIVYDVAQAILFQR